MWFSCSEEMLLDYNPFSFQFFGFSVFFLWFWERGEEVPHAPYTLSVNRQYMAYGAPKALKDVSCGPKLVLSSL